MTKHDTKHDARYKKALRKLKLGLLMATCLYPVPSGAQVESASGATEVYAAPNGVPIVDIATPNADGLSHNKYNKYNVDTSGLVLNNGNISQITRASELAGQIASNLNLQAEALVILNEVVAPNRSTLAGFTEVVGKTADVIVANPYGITCNGCGFINTPNVNLTTGVPILSGTALTGFRVENGDILITGAGLDGSEQDYLALVARGIKVEGQINAKELDIVAGTNDWDNVAKTATALTPSGAAPTYAVDSSALGGMYANRIRLISNEAGVGVRMNGEAAASSNDFTISASGKVELNNKISAERDIGISTTQSGADAIHATNAAITGKGNTSLSATAGEVHLEGGTLTAVGGNLDIASESLKDIKTAAGGDNNKRYAGQNLTLTQTGATEINGTAYGAEADFVATAGTMDVGANGATIYGDTIGLTTDGAMNLNKAAVKSSGNLALKATNGGIVTQADAAQGVQSTAGNVTIEAGNGLTNAGKITSDTGSVTATIDGTLNNSGTLQAKTTMDIADQSGGNTGTLTNTGTVLAQEDLSIDVAGLTNSHIIQGGGADTIGVTNTLTNNAGAKLLFTNASGNASISAGALSNAGEILSASTLDLDIGSALTNAVSSKIIAAQDLILRGLTGASYAVTNNALIQSTNGLLDIKGNAGTNAVTISAPGAAGAFLGNTVDLNTTSLNLANGSGVASKQGLTILTGSLTIAGSDSYIVAAKNGAGNGTGTITVGSGFTNNGAIHSGNDLVVSASSIVNSSTAAASALRNLTINATGGNLTNAGLLYGANMLTAGATGTFTNTGEINAAQDAAVTAQTFVNHKDVNVMRDLILSASVFRNEMVGGDTRKWAYEGTGFNPGGGHYETINGNLVFVEYGQSGDQDTRTAAEDGNRTGADTGSWVYTQYDDCNNPINDGGDKTCRYTAKFSTSQYYDGALDKPNLLAGRNMTIRNFDTGTNYGGVIYAAGTLTMDGNAGATFANDSLDLLRLHWIAQWNHYEDCNNITRSSCSDWVNYRSYDKRITDKDVNNPTTTGVTVIGSAGAGVSAGTLVVDVAGVTNTGSVHTVSASGTSESGAAVDTSGIAPANFGGITLTLPTNPNGFFVVSKNPNSQYLIETNPLFAGKDALGSDYLAKRFGVDVNTLQRRLGDGSYEAYLIREQLLAQTGSTVIIAGEDEAQQMQRLMDNGADLGKLLGLTYGKAPTPEQLASLAGDMVWMVEKEVNGEKVLAPVVYLSAATKAGITGGAVMTATNTTMNVDRLANTGGTIGGSETLNITSRGDITNTSGTIRGGNVQLASTEGSIVNETFTTYHGDQRNGSTQLGKTGAISSTGNLSLDAQQDIVNRGANMNAGGNADLNAGRNITFDTVQDNSAKTTESRSGNMIDGSTTTTHETSTTNVRSGLTVGGNLTTDSEGDTTFAGTDVNVDGDADINAGGNLNILSRDDKKTSTTSTSKNGLGVGGGVYGIETKTVENAQSRNKGSNINVGSNAALAAGKDLTIQGSNVESGGNMDLEAENVNIVEGRDTDSTKTTKTTQAFGKVDMGDGFAEDEEEEQEEEVDRGGVSAKASAEAKTGYENNGGVTLSETSITKTTNDKSTAAGSSVKSGGNMTINAENDVLVRGSDVEADGDVEVDAENVTVTAAVNTETSTYDNTTAKVGLYGSTENEAGASAEAEAYAAAEGKGSPEAGASASAQAGASSTNTLDVVRVEETTRATSDVTHTGGSIKSGGNAKINADNKLSVHGSSLESGGNMDLDAKDMAFTAAQDSHTETLDASHTRAGLYLDADASADAGASASTQGMVGEAEASANAEANAGVGLYGSNTTQGSVSGTTTAQTSSIKSGGNLSRTAENNITDEGTQIEAEGDFTQSSESWDSKAAANTSFSNSSSDSHTAKVGFYAEAGAEAQASASLQGTDHGAGANASVGVAASYSGSTSDKTSNSNEAVVSNIKSGGNVKTTTTGKTSLEGTNLESDGDMELNAGSLDYKAARNTESESESSTNIDASAKVGIDATKSVTGEIAGGYGEENSSSSSSTAVVGGMKSGGNLKVKTTGDANFEGTNIEADGDAGIDAGGDVNFNAARNTSESSETSWNVDASVSATKNKSKGSSGKGIEASGGYQTSEEESNEAVAGSIKSGGKLDVKAGNNATFEGTDLESGSDMSVEAGNDVAFNAAESTSSSSGWGVEASISGSTGGARGQNGKTRNREKEAEGGISGGYNESSETTSDVSDLSSGGNLKIKSGNDVNLEGTNIEAEGAADLEAGNDVNFTAATDTSHSIDFSAGAEGVVTKEGADEDGNGVQYETQKKGKGGFALSGGDSTTETGGSIKAKTIGITSGNDTNLEGTTTESKGDTTINAGGDVNLTAAESSHAEGGIGVGVGSKGAGLSTASIDVGASGQGVQMKSGNDVNITSGGQTVMEGTKIEADGDANIDAQGGVVKKMTGEAGFDFGLDHAGGEADVQGVEITEHGEDNSAVGDDSDALKAVFNKITDNGPDSAPPSQEQNDFVNEIERLDYDETLTPAQKEVKLSVLKAKLENQKAIDTVKQDETLTSAQKAKLLKELSAKQKELDE